jgi:CDP-diacylglycerol pyrophosphatase
VVRRSVGVALLLALVATGCKSTDPNALWHIVGGQCVPDEARNHSPAPCAEVDLPGGYAVLKDIVGDTQFLLIPTTRVSGIESPEILAPGAPNYWQAAWQARLFVDRRAGRELPREDISLAINSVADRSQNQLHIHVDCVRPDVQSALRRYGGAIGTQWTPFPVKLAGHDYTAMRIDQPDLARANPFLLLAGGIPGARADMGRYTLVVVGRPDGFVLLAGHGWGEALQDHACALAH